MTIAEYLIPALKGYRSTTEVFDAFLLHMGNIYYIGTDAPEVLYTDGSMITYDDGTEDWVASMWDASGDDLDSDICQ